MVKKIADSTHIWLSLLIPALNKGSDSGCGIASEAALASNDTVLVVVEGDDDGIGSK